MTTVIKLSIFCLVIILSITTYFLFTGPNELSIKLEDIEMHNKFVSELDKHLVPYRINNNGVIKYSIDLETQVNDIFNKTFEVNRSSFYVSDRARSDEIIAKLDNDGIPYEISYEDGKTKISWLNEYSNKVHEALNIKFLDGPLSE